MTPSPTLDDEVTYVSGLNSDGTLALNSFAAWNDDNPATYTGGYTLARKWFADSTAGSAGTPGGIVRYYFDPGSGWTVDEKQVFVSCLALWSAIANISFELTTSASAAQITFVRGTDDRARASYSTDSSDGAGLTGGTKLLQMTKSVVSIDTSIAGFGPITSPTTNPNTFSDYGGYPWQVILHEIGHALGLGHAGPYPVTDVASSNLQYSAYDQRLYTVMSYINPMTITTTYYNEYNPVNARWPITPTGSDFWFRTAVTWMPVDILAIQRLYGASAASPLSGGNIFGFNSNISGPIRAFFDFDVNTVPIVTLWSSGVNNTLDVSKFSDNAVLNLNPGTFSNVASLRNNIAIAYGTRIDTLYSGAGKDVITGNNNGNYVDAGAGDDVVSAGSGLDTLIGGLGNDTLSGGSDVDTAVFSGNFAAYTIAQASTGNFTVIGIDGSDSLSGIEFAKFDDRTFRLLPGEGVLADFNGDPAMYMAAIRDFDSNSFIAQSTRHIDPATGSLVYGGPWDGISGWVLAGAADVSGSGVQSHILFNNLIGRWAEITPQADGKVYFSNHGWAGDTRIVGIYIDPLVQSGKVGAGSDHDSQRRFQNDLFIGNLKSVLGAADYDRDGFQEVYFSLTDGTAFLHAYMHADGNIRYSNYQSKQQVRDYLAANNYTGSTGWLAAAQPEPLAADWTDHAPLTMTAAEPLAGLDFLAAQSLLASSTGI